MSKHNTLKKWFIFFTALITVSLVNSIHAAPKLSKPSTILGATALVETIRAGAKALGSSGSNVGVLTSESLAKFGDISLRDGTLTANNSEIIDLLAGMLNLDASTEVRGRVTVNNSQLDMNSTLIENVIAGFISIDSEIYVENGITLTDGAKISINSTFISNTTIGWADFTKKFRAHSIETKGNSSIFVNNTSIN